VWALAARAWGRPEWFDPQGVAPVLPETCEFYAENYARPRCTCPFGGLHDGLYADDPACPACGNGRG
jgi:hypothetical protein